MRRAQQSPRGQSDPDGSEMTCVRRTMLGFTALIVARPKSGDISSLVRRSRAASAPRERHEVVRASGITTESCASVASLAAQGESFRWHGPVVNHHLLIQFSSYVCA
jgi:hypothetical protein